MTLPELCECNETHESTTVPPPENKNKMGKAVQSVLQQAASEGRATCSLMACVNLLSARPDNVMLCVMPTLPQADATATIQSTLIRAICQEHSILVLSVDCDVKLAKAVCMEEGMKKEATVDVDLNHNTVLKVPSACTEDTLLFSDGDDLAPVMGFPCVLVEFPEDSSAEDEMVVEFCKEQLYGETMTEPYIELPD